MATKKTAAKKASAKSSGAKKSTTPLDRLVDAGLVEAGAVGWRQVSMDAVAARAGVALGEALLLVPSKKHLMLAFLARIDERTLGPVTKLAAEDSPRDRLFEILMRRFDALNERREEAKAVITGVARDPASAVAGLCRLRRSFVGILEAAGIGASGPCGCVRVAGLKAIAAVGLRAWMTDDSADLAKTMAALDRALDRAEKLASMTRWRGRGREEAQAAEA